MPTSIDNLSRAYPLTTQLQMERDQMARTLDHDVTPLTGNRNDYTTKEILDKTNFYLTQPLHQ
jgi:hypothetical protein